MQKKVKNNYIKLLLLIVAVVFVTIVVCNLYKNYESNKLSDGYISKHVSSIKYSELKNTLLELSGDDLLYFTYTGDKDIYKLEKKLENIVDENELEDKFIYVDMKSDNVNYKELNNLLNINNNFITKLPAILYYKDGEPIEYIDSSHGLIKASSFDQLLEKNRLGKYADD